MGCCYWPYSCCYGVLLLALLLLLWQAATGITPAVMGCCYWHYSCCCGVLLLALFLMLWGAVTCITPAVIDDILNGGSLQVFVMMLGGIVVALRTDC